MRVNYLLALFLFSTPSLAEVDQDSHTSNQESPTEIRPQPRPWRISIGLGISTGASIEFTDERYQFSEEGISETYRGSREMKFKDSPSINFDLRNSFNPLSWGYSIGVNFDLRRGVRSSRVRLEGYESLDESGDRLGVQSTDVYMNALYRLDSRWVQFGINYSFVDLYSTRSTKETSELEQPTERPPTELPTSSSFTQEGGLGYQIGGGFLTNSHVAVEFTYRVTAISLHSSTSVGAYRVIWDAGDGKLRSFIFSLRVFLYSDHE